MNENRKKFLALFQNNLDSNSLKKTFRLIAIFGFQIIIGVVIAKFYDSPIILVFFLGALTVAALVSIEYMFYALMFFLPFSQRFRMPSMSAEMQIPTEPLLAILIFAYFLRKIVKEDAEAKQRFPFWLPILAYISSLLISFISSPYLYFSIKGSFRAIAYALIAVLTYEVIDSPERLKRLFLASIVSGTISVGWTALFLAARISLWRSTSAYEGLLFTNYIYYGAFVAMILLILLSRELFDSNNFDQVRWTALLIFYAIALILCFSRIVWVSTIIAVIFLFFYQAEKIQHKKFIIIFIAGIFLLILSIIPDVSGKIFGRALTIFDPGYASNRNRIIRWGAALMMFLRNPIIGAGYNSFSIFYKENNPAHIGDYTLGAHNHYIGTLAEQGIIGLICWLFVIIAFFRYGFRLLKEIDEPFWRSIVIGLMSVMTFTVVTSMACSLLHSDRTGIPFWLVYGLLPAIGNMAKKEQMKADG